MHKGGLRHEGREEEMGREERWAYIFFFFIPS